MHTLYKFFIAILTLYSQIVVSGAMEMSSEIDLIHKCTNVTITNVDPRIEKFECKATADYVGGICILGRDMYNTCLLFGAIEKNKEAYLVTPFLHDVYDDSTHKMIAEAQLSKKKFKINLNGNEIFNNIFFSLDKNLEELIKYGVYQLVIRLVHGNTASSPENNNNA